MVPIVSVSSNSGNNTAKSVPRRIALTCAAVGGAASLVDINAAAAATLEPPTFSLFSATGGRDAGAADVAFEDTTVRVVSTSSAAAGGQRVPVALWYPTAAAAASSSTSISYPHTISVAKIARVLLNSPPTTPRWGWGCTS
jgi:hypothetical protein